MRQYRYVEPSGRSRYLTLSAAPRAATAVEHICPRCWRRLLWVTPRSGGDPDLWLACPGCPYTTLAMCV